METEHNPSTEIRQKRSAWFNQRLKPDMTFEEIIRLNEEALRSFPVTKEERQQKFEDLMAIPEFVL
jgi:hypothetical protein